MLGHLFLLLLGLAIIPAGEGRFLSYLPGHEYTYKLEGTASNENAAPMDIKAKIGYAVINKTDDLHEMLLLVHQLHLKPKGIDQGFHGQQEFDFSPWFSFVINGRGEVTDIYEDARHEPEAISFKKAFAGLIASKLHHKDELVEKTGNTWQYHTQERDGNGDHTAHYHASETPTGLKFNKHVTSAHNVPNAKSHSSKELHYHSGMKIIHTVHTREHLVVAQNIDNQKFRHMDKLAETGTIQRRFSKANFPDMHAKVNGRLSFISRQTLPKPIRRPFMKEIKAGTLALDPTLMRRCRKATRQYNWDARREMVTELVQRFRNLPEAGLRPQANKWFQELMQLVICMTDAHKKEMLDTYLKDMSFIKNGIFLPHMRKDAETMLDLMSAIKEPFIQKHILHRVFTAPQPRPRKTFAFRAIVQLTNFQEDSVPFQETVKVIEDLAFTPFKFPREFQHKQVRQAALLGIGSCVRQFRKIGQHYDADRLAKKLQDHTGYHDPHHYRRKREAMEPYEAEDFELDTITMIEALGNAGHPKAFGMIKTYINSTACTKLRRAGLHALRHYHSEEAANILLDHAILSSDEQIRQDARLTYLRHPKATLNKVQGPIEPSKVKERRAQLEAMYGDEVNMNMMRRAVPSQTQAAINQLKNAKVATTKGKKKIKVGSFWEGIIIFLEAPGINWKMVLGSNKAGAEFGIIAMNKLDIDIAPLKGYLKIDVHDEAFCRVLIGAIGLIFEVLVVRICFRGRIRYNLNILQEFSPTRIKRRFEQMKAFFKDLINNLSEGLDAIKAVFNGDASNDMANMVDALNDLPAIIEDAVNNITNTLALMSMLNKPDMPSFTYPSIKFGDKVYGLVLSMKKDIRTFFNALDTVINLILPNAWNRMISGGKMLIKGGNEMKEMHIKDGIGYMAQGLIYLGFSMLDLYMVKNETQKACFFLREEKPAWMDFRKNLAELKVERDKALDLLNKAGPGWYAQWTIDGTIDPVKKLSGGAMTKKQLKKWIIDQMKTVMVAVLSPTEMLKFIARRFLSKYSKAFQVYMKIKRSYLKVKFYYNVGVYWIQKTFGAKANKNFSRAFRMSDSSCGGEGFWPSRLDTGNDADEYNYDGVDVEVVERNPVVAPFSGKVLRTGKTQMAVRVMSGSLKNHVFLLNNVLPNRKYGGKRSGGGVSPTNVNTRLTARKFSMARTVKAGTEIATATKSKCDSNHIHMAVLKYAKTRGITLVPRYEWQVIDPTRFLESRLPGLPKWVSICDDYKFVWLNQVKAAGSIVGLAGQAKDAAKRKLSKSGTKESNLDDAKKADPKPAAQPMDPGADDKIKKAKEDAEKKEAEKAQAMQDKLEDIDDPKPDNRTWKEKAMGSLPSFSDLKEKGLAIIKDIIDIRTKRIGTVVNLLSLLQMNNTITELGKVLKLITRLIANLPCENPLNMEEADLKKLLLRRQLDTNGTKEELIKRLTDADPKCLMLGWMQPASDKRYCTYDSECLGITCCLTVSGLFMSTTVKVYTKVDPCQMKFLAGWSDVTRQLWTINPISINDVYIGIKGREAMNKTLAWNVKAMMFLDYTIVKTENQITISTFVQLCAPNNTKVCLAKKDWLLNNAMIPVPACRQDGTLIWPRGMWTNFLNSPPVRSMEGKPIGTQSAAAAAAAQTQSLQELVGLDPAQLSSRPPCYKASRTPAKELRDAFAALNRGGALTGSTTDSANVFGQLKTEMMKCRKMDGSIVTISNSANASDDMLVEISNGCYRAEACIDLNSPTLATEKSLRAYVDVNPCEYEFHIGFEDKYYTEHVSFSFPFGTAYWLEVGPAIVVNYTIDRDDSTNEYVIDLRVTVCDASSGTCALNSQPMYDLRLPVQKCLNETVINFPGNGTVESFLQVMSLENPTMTQPAFNLILKEYGVDNIFPDGSCYLPPPPETNCSTFISIFNVSVGFQAFEDPADRANLYSTCEYDQSCLGIHCCTELAFLLPYTADLAFKNFSVSFVMDPCQLTVNYSIGTFSRMDRLVDYKWGSVKGVLLGNEPHSVSFGYVINKDLATQHYIVTVQYKFCLYTIPGVVPSCGGGDLQSIPLMTEDLIPFCDAKEVSLVGGVVMPDKTIKEWMEWQKVNAGSPLSPSGLDVFFEDFYLKGALSDQQCDSSRVPFAPASNGWRKDCSKTIKNIPKLDENAVRCNIFDTCDGIMCCLNTDLYGIYSRTITAFLFVDNCHYQIRGGIEQTYFKFSTYTYNWGTWESYHISGIYKMKYKVSRDYDKREISVSVNLEVCSDPGDPCVVKVILSDTVFPMPICDMGEVVPLASDNGFNLTVSDFMTQMTTAGKGITGEVLEGILRSLGLANVIYKDPVCPSSWDASSTSCSTALSINSAPANTKDSTCRVLDNCRGFQCCVPITMPFMSRNFHIKLELTRCEYWLTLEFERYQFNRTLFLMAWGDDQYLALGNSARMKYNIKKDDDFFYFTASVLIEIAGLATQNVPILNNYKLPMQHCGVNSIYHLPYSKLIEFNKFINKRWPDYYTWEGLFRQLKYHPQMEYQPCRIPPNQVNYCPHLTQSGAYNALETITNTKKGFKCYFDKLCHGFYCCMRMDFIAFTYPMNVHAIADPCDNTYDVRFEKVRRTGTVDQAFYSDSTLIRVNDFLDMQYNISMRPQRPDEINDHVTYSMGFSTFVEDEMSYPMLNDIVVPKERCASSSFKTNWAGGSLETFANNVGLEGSYERLMKRVGIESDFIKGMCPSVQDIVSHANCPNFTYNDNNNLTVCELQSDCTSVQCCVNMTLLGQMSKQWDLKVTYLPCNYTFVIEFETVVWSINIFDNWGVEKRTTTPTNAFQLLFNADSTPNGNLLIDVSVQICIEVCLPPLKVLDKSHFVVPVCKDSAPGRPLWWPMNSTMNWIEHKKKGLARLIEVDHKNFFRPNLCTLNSSIENPSCPVLSLNTPSQFNCRVNPHCTGVECCYTLDTRLVSRPIRVWALIDACNFTFSFGIENWEVNSSLHGYSWGTRKVADISGTSQLYYTIDKTPDQKNFILSVEFNVTIDDYKVAMPDIVLLHNQQFPIPMCKVDTGEVSFPQATDPNAASGIFLTKLGADPENLLGVSCTLPSAPSCPHFSIPSMPSGVSCVANRFCTGVTCCVNIDVGVGSRPFYYRMHVDPCGMVRTVGFEKWVHNTSLYGNIGVPMSERIGTGITLNTTVNMSADMRDLVFDSSIGICPDLLSCTEYPILTNARVPAPFCKEDGTFGWPDSETVTQMGVTRQAPSALLLNALGMPAIDDLFNDRCHLKNLTAQAAACPHVATNLLPSGPGGVRCTLDDRCMGLICCVDLNLVIVEREFRVHAVIDPCSFTLTVGFENEYFNKSLYSYTWGSWTTENVGRIELRYRLDKQADGRHFYLSATVKHAHPGLPEVTKTLANWLTLSVPHCANDGSLTWPSHVYSNILPNIIGAPSDLLRETPCSPETAGSCSGMTLPSPAKCVAMPGCAKVSCCFSMDMFVVTRPFLVDFEMDVCTGSLTINVEGKVISQSLSGFSYGTAQLENIGTKMVLNYTIFDANSLYHEVDMVLQHCWTDLSGNPHNCEPDILMSRTRFDKPSCSRRKRAIIARRRKRLADLTHEIAMASGVSHTAGSSSLSKVVLDSMLQDTNKTNTSEAVQAAYKKLYSLTNFQSSKTSADLAPGTASQRTNITSWSNSLGLTKNSYAQFVKESLKTSFQNKVNAYEKQQAIKHDAKAAAKAVAAKQIAGFKTSDKSKQHFKTAKEVQKAKMQMKTQQVLKHWKLQTSNAKAAADKAVAKSTKPSAKSKMVAVLTPTKKKGMLYTSQVKGQKTSADTAKATPQKDTAMWSKYRSSINNKWSAASAFQKATVDKTAQANTASITAKYQSSKSSSTTSVSSTTSTSSTASTSSTKTVSSAAMRAKASAMLLDMKKTVKTVTARAKDWLLKLRTQLSKMATKAKYNTRVGKAFDPPKPVTVPVEGCTDASARQEDEAYTTAGPVGIMTQDSAIRKASSISIGLVDGQDKVTNLLTVDTATKTDGSTGSHATFGSGLTSAGISMLGQTIASTTFGGLESTLSVEKQNPADMMKVRFLVRNLTATILAELMSKIFNGGFSLDLDDFDLKLTGRFAWPQNNLIIFEYRWNFLAGGIVPVEFRFGAGAYFALNVLVEAKILAMEVNITATPIMGVLVWGALRIGEGLSVEVEIIGKICELQFPGKADLILKKFPPGVKFAMDLVMIPIQLILKVNVKAGFGPLQTTLFSANIWTYTTSPITKEDFIKFGDKKEDKTPPAMSSATGQGTNTRKRAVTGEVACNVIQLEGRDIYEPAFQISFRGEDDSGEVRYFLDVGTAPGGSDVFTDMELGGPTTIGEEWIEQHSRPLYFTIKGRNSGGGEAKIHCSVPAWDVTLPTGRMRADFATSSNPGYMSGTFTGFDDSPLIETNVGIGYGKDIWGDNVLRWQPFSMDRNDGDVAGASASRDFFTKAVEGRVVGCDLTESTTAVTVEECMDKCKAMPKIKCMSLNYDQLSTGTCELLAAIEGPPNCRMEKAEGYYYFERKGLGYTVEFVFDGLWMFHNQLSYLNVEMINFLKYQNVISSEGVLIDLTPPQGGWGMLNVTNEIFTKVVCKELYPVNIKSEIWDPRCRGQHPLVMNLRAITDGENSATVYNGGTPKTEKLFDRANSYLACNWDGIRDNETGVFNYAWTAGFQPCEERIFRYIDPHTMFVKKTEWTNIGVNSEIPPPYTILPDARYFFTPRAFSELDYGTLLATDFCHTTSFSIDNTDPVLYEVFGGTYDEETHYITVRTNATDPHSGIVRLDLCLGESTRDCLLMGFRQNPRVGDPFDVKIDIVNATNEIPSGIPAWPKIRGVNGVDLRNEMSSDSPILIDMTPPVPGDVYDGKVFMHDFNFTKDQDKICANWMNFYDAESGILYYKVGFGTSEGNPDLVELMEFSYKQSKLCVVLDSDKYLQHNHKYYAIVYAFNGGHKQLNSSASSDGILVDLTPPVVGQIVDGVLGNFSDIAFSSELGTVDCQWRNFYDSESGVVGQFVRVDIALNMSSNFEVRKRYTDVGIDAYNVEWHNFYLRHRDIIKPILKVTNGATNFATLATNTYVIDLTPPVLEYLGDGTTLNSNIDWQNYDNRVGSNWKFKDEESGLKSYNLIIYERYQGTRMQVHPISIGGFVGITNPATRTYEKTGMSLQLGARYMTSVLVENLALMATKYMSDGVVVDNHAPTWNFLKVGVTPDMDEITLNGKVWQADKSGILASWQALDGESGIANYKICVGTSSGSCNIKGWTNMGKANFNYINGLSLTLYSVSSTLYYVTVVAEDGAGNPSDPRTSTPILVVDEDKTGVVVDGPDETHNRIQADLGVDIDYQKDRAIVTAQYEGFESKLNGLRLVTWAIGTAPTLENIQAFMTAGCIAKPNDNQEEGFGIQGAGKCQAVVTLPRNGMIYVTVRVFTNKDNVLTAVSDGVMIDTSSPRITISSFGFSASGLMDISKDAVYYQKTTDTLVGSWNYSEPSSEMHFAAFAFGHFPDDPSVYSWTSVGEIPPSNQYSLSPDLIKPDVSGKVNMLSIHAMNNMNLWGKQYSASIIIDVTPPVTGTVTCPEYVQAVTELTCSWQGFRDPESYVVKYRFALGSKPGLSDIFGYVDVPAARRRYQATNFKTPLVHNGEYYATVYAVNVLDFELPAFSNMIKVDDTPPKGGKIIDLSGFYHMDYLNLEAKDDRNEQRCTNTSHCAFLDAKCMGALSQLAVFWDPFVDEETGILKYMMAIGSTPGGGQVKQFFDIPIDKTYYLLQNLDLNGQRAIYVTVKAFNRAGHFSIVTTNGVYITYVGQGMEPLQPLTVDDRTDPKGDKDYQNNIAEITAKWDFSGDPCPIQKYYWRIERVDGPIIQDWVDVKTVTQGLNDDVALKNGEMYIVIVKGINLIGQEIIVRSDGITIQKDALLPGQIFDGDVFGFDMLYQPYVDQVTVNWNGFGKKRQPRTPIPPVAGAVKEEPVELTTTTTEKPKVNMNQEVLYYEIALGTDRRYPKSRDNVVPFTFVGKNLTHTFYDLKLVPKSAIYYFTVRATSASMDKVEVTSNGFYAGFNAGVRAGVINMRYWWNNATYLRITWQNFGSEVGMFFYHVGVTTHTGADEVDCKRVIEGGTMPKEEKDYYYDVVPLTNVGDQSFVEVFNMTMNHTQEYYIYVYGTDSAGKCNVTANLFRVDTTDPYGGKYKAGPFHNMTMTFADKSDEITVDWSGYGDDESGLKKYEVQLVTADTCTDFDESALRVVKPWIALGINETNYRFIMLELVPNQPYYVQFRVTNNAESSIETITEPIVLDVSAPTAGELVDGWDFLKDRFWLPSATEAKGTLLHFASNALDPCPSRPITLNGNPDWKTIVTKGLVNLYKKEWNILYDKSNVMFEGGDTLTIRMQRDQANNRMISGAYYKLADIREGGIYYLNIKAGATPASYGRIVTSVLFWDGPDGMLGDFNILEEKDWTGEHPCACCSLDTVTAACRNICDCDRVVIDHESRLKVQLNESDYTTFNPNDTTAGLPSTTPAPDVPWRVIADPIEGDSSYSNLAEEDGKTSCGFQLIPGLAKSRGNMWCRYENDTNQFQSVSNNLDFNLTQWHTYRITFYRKWDDPRKAQWCYKVDVVDTEIQIGVMCGIPTFSENTKLVLHVWNKDMWYYRFQNPFDTFEVKSQFARVRIPPDQSQLCRYGDPWIGGTNAIVAYEGAIGSAENLADISTWQIIHEPCIPCINPCDRYYCNKTCVATKTETVKFTVKDINLPIKGEKVNDEGTAENRTLLYYLTVRAVLASGATVTKSTNGFSVDNTPPVLSAVYYVDVDVNRNVIISYQQSNHTIRSFWQCVDTDSEVAENFWAIGTSPGSTNIQNFTSTGPDVAGENNDLLGKLENNVTYYVSVICINGAGLSSSYNDTNGVTLLMDEPAVDDVNNTIPGASSFGDNIVPKGSKQATDPTQTGGTWTVSKDPSIDHYEYCIGSSNETLDDIVPCFLVAKNQSGTVMLQNGDVFIDGVKYMKIRDMAKPINGTLPTTSNFNMEPGRTLIHSMKICTQAKKCTFKYITSVAIVNADVQVSSVNDGNSTAFEVPSKRRRKKRSAGGGTGIKIKTPKGMQTGQSIIMGELTEDDMNKTYGSDASVDFQSFIVNPNKTADMVDRLLMKRVQKMPTSSFFFTPLGNEPLPGAMELELPYDNSTDNSTKQVVVMWDPSQQAWTMANSSCFSGNLQDSETAYNTSSGKMTLKICGTRKTQATSTNSVASRRKRSTGSGSGMSAPTMMGVASVSPSIPNEAPVMTSNWNPYMTEDSGTLAYQLVGNDPEGDAFVWLINSAEPAAKGTVSLSSSGYLSYRPPSDFYGDDIIYIKLYETRSDGVPAATTYCNVTVFVKFLNDQPEMLFLRNGQNLYPTTSVIKEVTVTVEQLTIDNVVYEDLGLYIAGYDRDANDTLQLSILAPTKGILTIDSNTTTAPTYTYSCGLNPPSNSPPCSDMSLPLATSSMAWIIQVVTYKPNADYYGWDEFTISLTDKGGSSNILKVKIAVLENKCIHNSTCYGLVAGDALCTSDQRATIGFDSNYACKCPSGWTGPYCQYDVDECSTNPCMYPYACYDLFNGYYCECPMDRPFCDSELNAWQIALICIFCCAAVIAVTVGICIAANRQAPGKGVTQLPKTVYNLKNQRRILANFLSEKLGMNKKEESDTSSLDRPDSTMSTVTMPAMSPEPDRPSTSDLAAQFEDVMYASVNSPLPINSPRPISQASWMGNLESGAMSPTGVSALNLSIKSPTPSIQINGEQGESSTDVLDNASSAPSKSSLGTVSEEPVSPPPGVLGEI